MKTEFQESGYGLNLVFTPETVEEMTQMLRFANNYKSEKPYIRLFFSRDIPSLDIWMRKVKTSVQKNSIGQK